MASKKIQGLTIEINGDTSSLAKSLKNVDKQLKDTQGELRDINKALKLDPSNVELLADKQSLLQDAISQSVDRLQVLKDAYEQNLSNPDVGEDEMKALKLEIDKATASLNNYNAELQSVNAQIDTSGVENMSDSLDDASSAAQHLDSNLQSVSTTADESGQRLSEMISDFGNKVTSVGDTLTKSITVPLTGIATAGGKAFGTIDSAYDTIVKMTGATGDNLKELTDIFDSLYGSMPEDSETIAKAIGEVNTKFGFMGEQLESVSKSFVEYSKLSDIDVVSAIDDTQSAMVAWGIEAEDLTKVLDTLNSVGQDTGADISQIAQMSNQYQSIFEELGYSFSDSARFLGELSKNGLDASSVMGTLTRVFSSGAKEGKSIRTSLFEIQDAMESGDETTAVYAELIDSLGKTGFVKLKKAIEDGRLSFGLMNTTIEDSAGNIERTYAAIQSPTDELTVAMHNVSKAFSEVFEALAPVLVDMMEKAVPLIEKFSTWWEQLGADGQELAVKVGLVAAAFGPVLSIFGRVISFSSSIAGMFGSIGSIFGDAGSTIASSAGQIAGSIHQVSSMAETASTATTSAASGLSSFAQSALGLVALGGAIALTASGLWLLSDAAVKISQEGVGAALALGELVVAIGALVAIFAIAGEALTAGAIGIGVFGAAVLGIGAGMGLLTAGLALLAEQLPTIASYGGEAVLKLIEIGGAISIMASNCLIATPELLAMSAAAVALAGSLVACDVSFATFTGSVLLSAGAVAVLDVAMLAFNATMDNIKDNALTTAESIEYIVNSVDIIEVAVNGLSDLVKNGLASVVEFFKGSSTEPVEAWAHAFNELYNTTVEIMNNVLTVVSDDVDAIANKIANTKLRFGNVEVPHFSIDGVFDIQKSMVPRINVDWYANGGIFNSPSVIGVGDSKSPEAVVPVDKLQQMVDFNGTNNQSVDLLSQMVGLLSQYLPHMANQQIYLDGNVLVGEMDSRLGTLQSRRARQ